MINKDFSIYLRAFETDDYRIINKWRNDLEMQRLTCGPIRYVSSEMEKVWVQTKMMNNTAEIYLAICSKETNVMIGYTSLVQINYINRSAKIGGMVIGDNNYRDGQALIEANYMILDYAFSELNMHRVYTEYLPEHIMTKYLCESLFYNVEGVSRDAVYKLGRFHDVINIAILKEEFDTHLKNGEYAVNSISKRLIKNIKSK